MPRRPIATIGGLLAGAGLLSGIASLAVPWGRYRAHGTVVSQAPMDSSGPIAVYQLSGGMWYLLAVGVLAGLLAAATLGAGRTPDVALAAAPAVGLLTALIVIIVANGVDASGADVVAVGFAQVEVTGQATEGVWIGLATGPLLGFGVGALALARRNRASTSTPTPVGLSCDRQEFAGS
ncbi:hypothetical protein ACNTMW_11355 [Planosporangium sp. 12N6]|uniref:hypothetical protein n=1 Tax=Planosporangium spinosum TaxID=3402278 RepID=UPI003CEC703B